jgi:aromatic-amino-acid transaminase
VNLGVGVYFDDNGKLPLLECVQAAEKAMMEKPTARGYLPIDGIAAYDNGVKALVFGAESDVVKSGRVATVQAIGGTGGLKIGADFLKKLNPNAKVLISNPSWENHKAIFTNAGFEVGTYAYYDAATRSIDFAGMLADLNAAAAGTVVVLHACCHNPTGYDITAAQWDEVIAVVKAKGLVAFLDMAYQGFGHGIAEDGAVIGKFVAAGLNIFRLDLLLQELQPVRRARGRPVRGGLRQGRSRSRAVAAEDRHPHQLLQPSHPWRRRWQPC